MNCREKDCKFSAMDSARSWLQKFQPRAKKKAAAEGSKAEQQNSASDEAPSSVTKQKVEAAKQYIENHYKAQMKSLEDRKER